MELRDFIVKAKRSTYASGAKPKVLNDGFEELTYVEGNLLYIDRWKGSNPFGGEEIVRKNGKVVWLMNYYGYILSDKIDSKKVYGFLRKAMSLVDKQKPFRGPSHFKEGYFEYLDDSEGTFDKFRGTERILYQRKEIYKLDYHGGKV